MDKIDICVIFLYKLKRDHSVATAVYNINRAFGVSTVNEHTALLWLRMFCSGDTNFEN